MGREQDPFGERPPTVLVVGCGAVGRAVVDHLAGTPARLVVSDPAQAGETRGGVTVSAAAPDDLSPFDLVLAAVPAGASAAVAARAAESPGAFLHVDLSSSPREAMREAAARFEGRPARFVDGAIMGSVDLHGARTPILLAGPGAQDAAAAMNALGFVARALPASQAGDAVALKLLRSVLTKGLEALTAECFVAARTMGLEDALRGELRDIGETPFVDFLDMLLRTHVVHAPRRRGEVAAALAQLEAVGAPATVTQAVLEAFARTAARLEARPAFGSGTPDAGAALAWLGGGDA